MIHAYIRVSSDKQTVENQRFEIQNYAVRHNLPIDEWVEETISSTKAMAKRALSPLLAKLRKEDVLLVSELSRLGRNLMQIMSILHECMKTEIRVIAIKENYEFGNNISSKVLAFAFGLSAEIERNLISQRTKEALQRKKSEGFILGRPKGVVSKKRKLSGKDAEIIMLLEKSVSITAIGRLLGVHRLTVTEHIKSSDFQKKLQAEEGKKNLRKHMMLAKISEADSTRESFIAMEKQIEKQSAEEISKKLSVMAKRKK